DSVGDAAGSVDNRVVTEGHAAGGVDLGRRLDAFILSVNWGAHGTSSGSGEPAAPRVRATAHPRFGPFGLGNSWALPKPGGPEGRERDEQLRDVSIGRSPFHAGGRRGKERAAQRSSDWRRGARRAPPTRRSSW